MNFLILDDEPLALNDIKEEIASIDSSYQLYAFLSTKDALDCLIHTHIDVAFLDIEMGAVNGVELSQELKTIQPDIHIIFVTAYPNYAVDAFTVKASGYLLKPASRDEILRELTHLFGNDLAVFEGIKATMLGEFKVTIGGKKLELKRDKANDVLAFLLLKQGEFVLPAEICTVIWPDIPFSTKQKNIYQQLLVILKNALEDAGAGELWIRQKHAIALDTERIECDYYKLLATNSSSNKLDNLLPHFPWVKPWLQTEKNNLF